MTNDIYSALDYDYRITTLEAECDLSDLANCQGFSFQPFYGVAPTRGYMVSARKDLEERVPLGEVKPDDLYRYMNQHMGLFEANPRLFFGGWSEEGEFFLDVSRLVNRKRKALQLGRKHKQLAIYDLTVGKSISVETGEYI